MQADLNRLIEPIDAPGLHLEQLEDAHREPLRALCPADDPVWDIYPVSYAPDRFDESFAAMRADQGRRPFALFADGVMVGMSGYLNISIANRAVDIGGTYLTPAARGTGLNRRIKHLLIGRAIEAGFHRIAFRVDLRNGRSMAAVEKLGAVREGVLRRERITWTGHVRDTAVYSILADEWSPS
ncbi:GNAT family N-acetyltransferase [Sphingomonas prati]|uniref:RimJ/RimL family protein N-acetyltransferase n=1 Tax=Sphingomonas prati TaxID=1843237 RepID=A0A7W9BRH8_9SPHN|nr:GNAT family protein [Sphingomonas prati]MBB5728636.1 RimJ/RimL family protein N-acetyltransferase [Sphingomonas prati]GGE72243.1 ribosomal-protein-alanine acetyltransferase [Sphingomonas prati]